VAVATRYVGVFTDGTWKARGLAYRRHDVPVFIQRTPLAMLGVLAEAEDVAGVQDQLPRAIEVLRDSWDTLATCHIPLVQLLVSKSVSRARQRNTASTPPPPWRCGNWRTWGCTSIPGSGCAT
jgi:DNA polymerase elongation subunit (family B)